MVIGLCSIARCIIFGVLRLPVRPCDERPPAMYGHFGLVPRVSVHDRYYCRHIHYPVNPSSDHFHTDVVVPSGDRNCIDIVGTSSDHYGSTKVAPPTDHLHTKRTQQGKLIGEKKFAKSWGACPCGYDEEGESDDWTGKSHFSSHGRRSSSPAVGLPTYTSSSSDAWGNTVSLGWVDTSRLLTSHNNNIPTHQHTNSR